MNIMNVMSIWTAIFVLTTYSLPFEELLSTSHHLMLLLLLAMIPSTISLRSVPVVRYPMVVS